MVSNRYDAWRSGVVGRRALIATAATAAVGLVGHPLVAATPRGRRTPRDFLWGAAISAHQSEGNNTHSDSWLLENLPVSAFAEPSGDACDSYHRFEEDFGIAGKIGLNAYRFGIEWARIEPEPGRFALAELDHYKRMLEACREHRLTPVVTFNHFSVPLWFAQRGGWEMPDAADLFARYCARATEALGPLIGMASTFNEANVHLLIRLLRNVTPPAEIERAHAMLVLARKATNSPSFSSLLFGNADRMEPILLDAHAKGMQAIKAGPGSFPVGVTLTMQQIEAVGPNSIAPKVERALYGGWLEAAKASDFIGVQTYTRLRFDAAGAVPPPPGAEMTAAGYEYYPGAVGYCVRFAAREVGQPIFVTETGIATNDDTRRVAFIDATLGEVRKCIDAGIPVHGYFYWSLLDNFEWTKGYSQRFGLVSVDRKSFQRTLKPSANYLGRRARAGLI